MTEGGKAMTEQAPSDWNGSDSALWAALPVPAFLIDDAACIVDVNSAAEGFLNTSQKALRGKLSVLLQWHAQDPVDAKEMARTNAIFSYQGNRNPFVDHPEWVDCIFSGQCNGGPSGARVPEVSVRGLG